MNNLLTKDNKTYIIEGHTFLYVNNVCYHIENNIKIKEYFSFLKITLNLGFLAKHLTYNKDISVILDDENEKDIIKIETQLKKVTQKYYKYKTKYFKVKNPNKNQTTTDFPLSITSYY